MQATRLIIKPKPLSFIGKFLAVGFSSLLLVSYAHGSTAIPAPKDIVGVMSEGEPISLQDAKSLSPVCLLIYAQSGTGTQWYTTLKNSPLLDRAEYVIARNAVSYHHVCWAEVSRSRYYRAKSETTRKRYLLSIAGNYEFMTAHPEYLPIGWPHMAEMFLEIGKARSLLGQHKEAINAFIKALNLQPDSENVYITLSNYMETRGAKQKALEYATEGLKHVPESKTLKRRYIKLGGKEPFPTPHPKHNLQQPVLPPSDRSLSATTPQISDSPTILIPDTPHVTPPPFCRFCP